jgi:hypothetical protein
MASMRTRGYRPTGTVIAAARLSNDHSEPLTSTGSPP